MQRKSQWDRHNWDLSPKCKSRAKGFASQIAVQDWIYISGTNQCRLHDLIKKRSYTSVFGVLKCTSAKEVQNHISRIWSKLLGCQDAKNCRHNRGFAVFKTLYG